VTFSSLRLWTLVLVTVCCAVLPVAVQAASPETAYGKARKAYFELLESPRKQKYRDQWLKVRDLFLAVRSADPRHQRASDALYMAGKVVQGLYEVSLARGDLKEAIGYFDRLALDHPGSTLADDGLFLAAEILDQKFGDRQGAIDRYRRVLSIYADADMAEAARERPQALAPEAIPRPEVAAAAPPPQSAGNGSISGVRYHTYPEFTRVVLDMEQNAEITPGFVKGDAPRIFIDVKPAKVAAGAEPVILEDGRVQRVRLGQYQDDVARVVLDLSSSQPYQVFTLNDPFRVIIDVSGPAGQPSVPAEDAEGAAAPPQVVVEPSAPPTAGDPPPNLDEDRLAGVLAQKQPQIESRLQVPVSTAKGRSIRIVLDPGHGGKDPGAIGPRGVMEKEVTLAMAKELAAELKSRLPCEVILTRDRDVYIPLDERTLIANRLDADLFISVHANANRSRKPYGVETYYLNFSKNDDVIEVVARENGTSLQKVGDLDMILLDLMANSKINESSRLAAEIQESLVAGLAGKYSHIKDLGVRQGPFHVLWNATMPSVLVEVAFISNEREEKRLADRTFQKRSAAAITRGVSNYLEAYSLAAN